MKAMEGTEDLEMQVPRNAVTYLRNFGRGLIGEGFTSVVSR